MPNQLLNTALSVVEIGEGLSFNGFTLSATPATGVQNTVIAAAGQPLTLAGNGGNGAEIILGVTDTITLDGVVQGLRIKTTTQAGNYSVTSDDYYVAYTGAGSQAFTLPAISANTGKILIIKNRGTGNLTLQCSGADELFTTTNVASFSLVPGVSATVLCDGSYWTIISLASGIVTES